MDIFENQSSIEYEYKINPTGDALTDALDSNITQTDLILGELGMVKSVDKNYATIGDILTYTVVLSNIGNVLLTDIIFTDIIPSGATFVTGSVKVDGVSQPTYDPNIGFNVGSLIILGSRTIIFEVEVTSLPNPNTIINTSLTEFNYLVILPITGNSTSNSVTTTINVNNLSIVKSASVEAVTIGDTLTYTTVITNNGNINAVNIEFKDIVPDGLTFVTGSVTIDDVPQPTYDPNVGFSLNTLAPTGSITVVFDTTVDNV